MTQLQQGVVFCIGEPTRWHNPVASRRDLNCAASPAQGCRGDLHYRPPDKQRDATVLNLVHECFEGWTEPRTRPDRDDLPNVWTFKTAERTKVEAEGYTTIADVGDQISDLEGSGGCTFKVPNPFYFIP